MIVENRENGIRLDHPEVDMWVLHYDKGTNETFIMIDDEVMETLPGYVETDDCSKVVADNWLTWAREPNMDMFDLMYPKLLEANAIRVDYHVSNDWSLEPIEEIMDGVEDGDNPIVLSVYGVDNVGERYEHYFDLTDFIEGEIKGDVFITADKKELVVLMPVMGSLNEG